MNEVVPPFPQEMIDAANRMRDAVNLHVTADHLGVRDRHLTWVAIKLEDGRSDGNLYETRQDAVNHTQNKSRGWAYLKVGAEMMSEREAILVLQMFRQAFSKGVIFAEQEVVVPQLPELMTPFIPKTIRGLEKLR